MNESSPPSTTSLENTNAPTQPKAPVRFPNVPFAYYPPPARIHDTRASRRAAAAAHTQDELPARPRESRWDRPHRQSTKKQSTSPGRTRQAAMDATEAARNAARASTVEMKRSTTYNIPHREGVTAQPARKKHERGQSPTKTMRTYNTRGIATQLPEQSPSHVDDARDAANLVYDICFNATDIDKDVPATFHEAMQSQDAAEWLEACKKEIGNLKSMGCYELSHAPSGKQALKSKWVFKRKDMPDGQKIFKARVVIKGFAQRQGLDYDETYAPVICGDSLRLVLAIVAIADMKCRQGDATNAYIHAKSDRDLHMTPPDGFEEGGKSWRILGALYGLKQSALLWYQHFKHILESLQFTTTLSDSCVFTRHVDSRLQIITIYVDDVLVCASSDEEITQIFAHLQQYIHLNDLGPISKLLGMEISRNTDLHSINITQTAYIERMATKYGLQNSKPVETPIPAGTNLMDDTGPLLDDDKLYRKIVGSLLYCAMATRPDIAHSVAQLSRYLSAPRQLHMLMAKRTVAYLFHTKNDGISFHGQPQGSSELIGFSDSDDRTTGRSTCGYVWMLGCGPISWHSKLQSIVTLTSTEAEYVGACLATQHGMHLSNLLAELGVQSNGVITLYLDNQSSIAIGSNQSSIQRTKHLALRFYFLRDLVRTGAFKRTATKGSSCGENALP
ncbi:hypothetical protein Ae201684P_013148 [Aphanomyces euteiches]|uniref:Reverse transcriptase Ty1/copia-type domain-containing protein n=2 Tax=Aphanomyces euteiches TaxID=100861 RepID=A0A6G0WS40_9STRA|nr:hypothetical protein Ae201684_012298 [Aphanomyces euteiches]KAH9096479.1 hypothetical protein Ae201684P_013148 [Aphanomyces euteiches]